MTKSSLSSGFPMTCISKPGSETISFPVPRTFCLRSLAIQMFCSWEYESLKSSDGTLLMSVTLVSTEYTPVFVRLLETSNPAEPKRSSP